MQMKTTVFINAADSPLHEVVQWMNVQYREKTSREATLFYEKMKDFFPEFKTFIDIKLQAWREYNNIGNRASTRNMAKIIPIRR